MTKMKDVTRHYLRFVYHHHRLLHQ